MGKNKIKIFLSHLTENIKTFAHLEGQGVDIGDDGRELVAHSEWVKESFVKKWAIDKNRVLK